MATAANPPPGATAANDPFTGTPSHAHPAPLRYAPFDSDQFSPYATNSPLQARRALEAHLKDTDRRIQDASKLGTTLLQQRKDLAARLKEVEELQKDNEVPSELRQKLAELEKEYNDVGRESARAFLPKPRNVAAESAAPSVFSSQARDSPSKLSAPSRRQRNQPTNRFHDIEFATEISTQLLAQVRQLQAALAEKDEALQNVTTSRTQLEDEHANLAQRMKQMDEAIQRHRDENWNLETKIQDLETSLRESGNTEQRLNQMLKTTQMEKSTAQRELEDLKVLHEKAIDEHDSAQRQQEGDLHTLRRDVANHDTERVSLQKKIEELTSQNTELAKAVSYRLMNQGGNRSQSSTRAEQDSDSNEEKDMDNSDAFSPIKGTPVRAGMLESETLKSSLNHAHRMIQNLKNNIHREKTEKLELKRMLTDARDELEKKRETGAGGVTAANMSKKRRSEAETVKFRKPSRPERLGASRAATTEILEDEPDWEDHEDPETPSKSRFGGAAVAGGTLASAAMPGAFAATETESSDAFETADERRGDTATETEAFQTGAESLGEDSDELTETESGAHRGGTIRRGISPNTAARPGLSRDRISYMSTASTSADESEDEVVKTPVQNQGPKYRIRVSRGPNSRSSRPSELFSDSPVSSVGTPQPAGKSLGDELDALDDDDDSVEGTPNSLRSTSSNTASPETTRMASLEPELPPDSEYALEEPIQSVQEVAEDDEDADKPTIGSPFSSPVKSPRPEGDQAVLAHQANSAMLAHEIATKKPAMVDAGVMTEPWQPEKEVVVQPLPPDTTHDDDGKKTLKERAGDVVGGALAGFGLGRLSGKDEAHTQQKEVKSSAQLRNIGDEPAAQLADPEPLHESKTLSTRASVHGFSQDAEVTAAEPERSQENLPAFEPTAVPIQEPKVLCSSILASPHPVQQPVQSDRLSEPVVPFQLSTIVPQETEPVQAAEPVKEAEPIATPPEPIAFQLSHILSQETEPVSVPPPAAVTENFETSREISTGAIQGREPVAFQLSDIFSQETEPVSVPSPAVVAESLETPREISTGDIQDLEPVAFQLSDILSQETEPVSPPPPAVGVESTENLRETSPDANQGLTESASHNEEVLAAAAVAGAAGAALGAKSTEQQAQTLDFSTVVSQDFEPVGLALEPQSTPLLPRHSSRRLDELYTAHALPAGAPEDRQPADPVIPGTDSAELGASLCAPQAPPLLRSRSRSMPANHLRPRFQSDVPEAIEPRVYGGGKGSGNIPTLIFGSDDDYEQMPLARAPSVREMFPQALPQKAVTPDSEGLIPAAEPLKIRKPMADGGSQTVVSGDEIERMMRDKSTYSAGLGLSLGGGALAGLSAGHVAGSPRRSVDAAAPSDASLRAPRRPASSSSMRKGFGSQPPLPADHTQKIAAAAGKAPVPPITPGQKGSESMGPPTIPASAYRNGHQSRPKTPTGGHGNATIYHSVSKEGTTPRPGRTGRANSPSGMSRRTSVSSFASELDERFNIQRGQFVYPDDLPPTTDPRMIQAITQTMIGEYLWKYTRKAGRSETSNTRHRRFFWVHPYTRTLYWSEKDPATAGKNMMKAKSLPIESVRVITDDNTYPPGLHRKSIVVITPGREVVFTAPTGQRHETWFNALSYLLLRTEHERAEQEDTINEEDLEEFNPPPFSIRRSISRMTGRSQSRQSMNSSYASQGPRTCSPQRSRAAETPSLAARQSAANRLTSTPTPTLLHPTAPHSAGHHASASSRARRDSSTAGGRMSSFTSKFRHSSMHGSVTSSRPGAQSALSHRSGRTEGSEAGPEGREIYNASVVSDSAEDLRAVIEQQEQDADRVENVRACCDGKHDVGSLASRRTGRHASFIGKPGGPAHAHTHTHAHPRAEPMKDAHKPRRGE